MPELFHSYGMPLPVQIGVPSQDAFPFKPWSRVFARHDERRPLRPLQPPYQIFRLASSLVSQSGFISGTDDKSRSV